jgi:tetratricopeptide (TPR) repeat protein
MQMPNPDLVTRLANAADSCVRYLGTFAWPQDLSPLYPYPRSGIPESKAAAAAVFLLLASVAAAHLGRRRPYLATGWLWYLVTLVPVIGLVQVGGQSRADRYTYLTMIGVTIALVWLAGDLWPRRIGARRALFAAFAVVLAALAASSAAYVRVWRDNLTLFEHAVRVTSDNYLMLNNLGIALMERGRNEEALGVLREEARINPERCDAHYNVGQILASRRQYSDAIEPLVRALACYERQGWNPHYVADTHYNMGLALAGLGRYAEAEAHLAALLRIMPSYPGGRAALDSILVHRQLRERPPP